MLIMHKLRVNFAGVWAPVVQKMDNAIHRIKLISIHWIALSAGSDLSGRLSPIQCLNNPG